jgi:tetratricopeptide (TPR) repeat protein
VTVLGDLASGHLTSDEIAVLIANGPAGISADRANHASSCEVCGPIIAMYEEVDMRLQRLAGGPRKPPTEACPPAAEWARLAAGMVDAQRSDELLAHASGCDFCGASLHAVVEDFSQEISETESDSLRTLESAKATWQRQMAHKMAQASGGSRVVPMRVPVRLAWAAGIVLAVGAAWMAWIQWNGAGTPEQLIAKAYTQERPFEFRVSGAAHVELSVQRRGAGSAFQRPAALIEAQSKIARELEGNPDNVRWLDLRARAEMLGWDSATAISTLQRALDRSPDDPALMADLGTAYALQADAQNQDVDYGRAAKYLEGSLKAKPNSLESIFNLALVYGRMARNDDAIREWRLYLDLDRSGPWHEEAQRRMSESERKRDSGRR